MYELIQASSKTLKLSSVLKISESLKRTDIVVGSTEPASKLSLYYLNQSFNFSLCKKAIIGLAESDIFGRYNHTLLLQKQLWYGYPFASEMVSSWHKVEDKKNNAEINWTTMSPRSEEKSGGKIESNLSCIPPNL